MAAHLLARGRLAGAQQHRNRAAGCGVVDMDRQEAALVVMGVEQSKLLVTVDDIDRVVDIEGHRRWRVGIAGAVQIDHDRHQSDQIAQARSILPARDGRLRAQVTAGIGQPPAGQLEGRVGAQPVEVVAILITAGDGEDPGAQDIGQQMGDPVRITAVRDHCGEPLGDAEPALRLGQQHDTAIRTEPPAIEGSGDLFALDGWKREWQQGIVGHGGRGPLRSGKGLASATESYARSIAYATSATPIPPPS